MEKELLRCDLNVLFSLPESSLQASRYKVKNFNWFGHIKHAFFKLNFLPIPKGRGLKWRPNGLIWLSINPSGFKIRRHRQIMI
ncbi:glutamyl-tRNA(Gln) amidotransferase subunit B, mitochondrial [Puccinia sorghi]|uniref:Glutamyl-tRNA(Gln) amidotransferase subunit B, mitochondrial n=1 Tax=Puccinia sorghi TaxID=27349 RepID=A0A0L6VE92_9BASI|nr:glutamyl-tRNA(Gln) amidotransferase subunit B, mitochondrial [Puccinia sorghi]